MGNRIPSAVASSVRRLVLADWPVDAVARLHGLSRADVRGLLWCPIHGRWGRSGRDLRRRIRGCVAARVKRAHREGWSAEEIAEAEGLAPERVRDFLARHFRPRRGPRRPASPWRAVRAHTAARVRRAHLAGRSAQEIAEAERLAPERVRDFLARHFPATPPPREPRPPAEPVRRAWGWARGPEYRDDAEPNPVRSEHTGGDLGDDQADDATAAVPELPHVEPVRGGDLGDWSGTWHRGCPGATNGNAALTEAGADRVRELRSRGVPRRDVATMMGVSVATVTRITRGETYRPPTIEPPPPRVEPPAIAAAEAPKPTRWTQPGTGRGKALAREWRDD